MQGDEDLISVGDLAGHELHIHSMSGDESLGGRLPGLFEYRLEVASADADIKPKDVLGEKLTIKIRLPDEKLRYFNGHVTSWRHSELRHDSAIYHVTLHPWLWMLHFTSDCRIFNKKSAIDIVQTIFAKYQSVADFDVSHVVADHPKYEYVVQYRESDFSLVCRLLQQEGIYFFFVHQEETHTLVLAEGVSAHKPSPGFEEIPYMPPTTTAKQMAPHFDHCAFSQDIRVRAFRQLDYNFEQARANMLARSDSAQDEPRYSIGEIFDYPGRYREQSVGTTVADVRLEELQEPSQTIEAKGNPLGLGVGQIVTIPNPPWSDDSLKFLVTAVHYDLSVPDEHSGGGQVREPYRANYTLQPENNPFRPPRNTSKPLIFGPQTAVVVGKKKTLDRDPEEIETDPYGRVRVRFHWERIGDKRPEIRGDADSLQEEDDDTCYVRVAQLWAGSKWGAIYIPRIGQEVVVEFLEGDPDRPIITGCVYNSKNMPPYELPKHMTQSGIKSRSTKGGTANNFNELRFEDLKGQEQIYIQAEKDLDIQVKNDEARVVGNDRDKVVGNNESVNIGVNRTESVGADEKIDIGGNRTETVGANESITIAANRTKSIGANETVTIAAASTETIGATRAVTIGIAYQLTVGGAINETVGAAKAEEIGGAKSVKVGAASSEDIGGTKSITAGGTVSVSSGAQIGMVAKANVAQKAGKNFVIEAADSVAIKCGSATLVMKKSGEIMLNGQKINLKASGDIGLKGSNIKEN